MTRGCRDAGRNRKGDDPTGFLVKYGRAKARVLWTDDGVKVVESSGSRR
ncbi:MAG: hypothetical protein LC781_08010 [Actinobacteria bacterium]|nr:hypothetical protein [Actinomycetota bacterium]